MKKIYFICVKKNIEHIDILFNLLQKRTYSISHLGNTKYEDHFNFVMQHPYRTWYLIKVNDSYVGSVYLLKNNCLGIYINSDEDLVFPATINFIKKKFSPLPEIKSVRPKFFYLNISPENIKLITIINKNGLPIIQQTFQV